MKATLWRALGALIGGVAGVGGGIGIREGFEASAGFAALGIGGLVVVSVVLYLIARSQRVPETVGGELMAGLLLGLTTGINGVLLEALFGPIVAIVICLIPLLAIVQPLARTDVYQVPLGWVNWVLPMSWPIVGLGLVFIIVSLLLGLLNLALRTVFLKIEKVKIDAKTGTTFLVGGLAGNSNLQPGSTGYNMGNFAFLRKGHGTDPYLVEHEAGHTLNLAIFGWVVHLIGALDENVFGGHADAYTEHFAEGNVPVASRTGPAFPMWGPPAGGPPLAQPLPAGP